MNHPHWAHHYRKLGGLLTACGRSIAEPALHTTDQVPKVTCRWCLSSDEVSAQRMELALSSPQEEPIAQGPIQQTKLPDGRTYYVHPTQYIGEFKAPQRRLDILVKDPST